MKKKLIYIGIFASLLVSCTESLEDKAAREAKEYTEKYCPTPHLFKKQGRQQEGD